MRNCSDWNHQYLLNQIANADVLGGRKSRHKISQYKKITIVKMYILGPGDGIQIELLNIPELSGKFDIGPDGTVYLPRLRSLYRRIDA